MMPMPPSRAIVIAARASVTESIAALTIGMLRLDVAGEARANVDVRRQDVAVRRDEQDVVERQALAQSRLKHGALYTKHSAFQLARGFERSAWLAVRPPGRLAAARPSPARTSPGPCSGIATPPIAALARIGPRRARARSRPAPVASVDVSRRVGLRSRLLIPDGGCSTLGGMIASNEDLEAHLGRLNRSFERAGDVGCLPGQHGPWATALRVEHLSARAGGAGAGRPGARRGRRRIVPLHAPAAGAQRDRPVARRLCHRIERDRVDGRAGIAKPGHQ